MDDLTLKNASKILSLVGIFISVFFALPIVVGLFEAEAVEPFLVFDLGLFVVSFFLYLSMARHEMRMRTKDAILTVNASWIFLGVLGAVPFVLSTHVGFVDGFFEAVSGYTTTGATIYSDIEALPKHI